MQFITNPQTNTWKRIPFVLAAGAAALAIGLVVSGLLDGSVSMPAMTSSDAPSAPAPQVAAPPAVDAPAEQGMTYIYIVGSELAATELWHGIYQTIELGPDKDTRHVLVVDSPAAERDLFMLQQEIEGATSGHAVDAGVTLVDLR